MIDALVKTGSKTPSQVNCAGEGLEVALHLTTMDSSMISRGNIVIKR